MIHKSEYGTIKFRKPNVIEGLELLGNMGLNSDRLSDAEYIAENEMMLTAKMIQNLEPLIEEVKLKIDNKAVKSFNECLEHFCLIPDLSEISNKVMQSLQVSSEKKKRS